MLSALLKIDFKYVLGICEDLLLRHFNPVVAGLTKMGNASSLGWGYVVHLNKTIPLWSQDSFPGGCVGRCGKDSFPFTCARCRVLGGSPWLAQLLPTLQYSQSGRRQTGFSLSFPLQSEGAAVALFLIPSFCFSWSCHSGEGLKGSLHGGSACRPDGMLWHHLVASASLNSRPV